MARAGDIEIEDIRITGSQGKSFSIKDKSTGLHGFNIYESAVDYHTYADITFMDFTDFLGEYKINGNEEVEISFKIPGGQSAKFKLKPLLNGDLMNQVTNRFKDFTLKLVSPEFLTAQSTVVDRSWESETHKMVEDIVKDFWKSSKEVDVEKTKGKQRFIGNSMPPHRVLDMLKNRHVSSDHKSSAYSLFETRDGQTQKFKFWTFEKMMKTKNSDLQTFTQNVNIAHDFTTGNDMWNIKSLYLPQTFNTVHRWSSSSNRSTYCFASGRQLSKEKKYKEQESEFKFLSESPITSSEADKWDNIPKEKKPFRHTFIDKLNDQKKTEVSDMKIKKAAFMARFMNDRGSMIVHGNPNIRVGETVKLDLQRSSDASSTQGSGKQINADVLVTRVKHQVQAIGGRMNYSCVVEFVKAGVEEGSS